jgi:hypothetical protein
MDISIDNPASIISAIPAILRFSPQSSIVALLIRRRGGNPELKTLLRIDLDLDDARRLTTATAQALRDVSAVILVAIAPADRTVYAGEALDIVRASFTELGIATTIRLLAAALDEPGDWTNIDTGETGSITPFGRTAFAAESVYRGHRVAATREDILAEFTAVPNPAPILHDDPADSVEDTFETLTAVITGTAHPHHHPDLASRLAVLLADVQLRDVALLISLDHAQPAAALWTQLANQLTSNARLGMLTIAAGAYYAAYDTVRAGIALDIAADEAAAQKLEFPRLASMLLSALSIGMPPEKVRVALGAAGRHRDT